MHTNSLGTLGREFGHTSSGRPVNKEYKIYIILFLRNIIVIDLNAVKQQGEPKYFFKTRQKPSNSVFSFSDWN